MNLNRLIDFLEEDRLEELNYFKKLVSLASLLNRLGILKGSDYFEQIVDFVSVDEIFGNEKGGGNFYSYEKKKLTSCIYLYKKENKLYGELLQILTEELSNDGGLEIGDLSQEEIDKILLEYYQETLFELIKEYTATLDKIGFEYDLKNIDVKINNRKSVLIDSKISLYSPLLFGYEKWKEIILNELMLSSSLEEIEQKKVTFYENLFELEALLPRDFNNLLLIDINETNYWLNEWNDNRQLFIYPVHFWIGRKKYFLKSLCKNKLKREFNKNLVRRYNQVKNELKNLKNQLKRNRLEVKKEKYFESIVQGMNCLLFKENSNLPELERYRFSEKIIKNLFYSNNSEPEEFILDPSIKINNIVLIEFILFLKNEKKYLSEKQISIPRLISDNLNYDSKGFSYQNLNKIYKDIEKKNEFNFNNFTSVSVLSKRMRMRNY